MNQCMTETAESEVRTPWIARVAARLTAFGAELRAGLSRAAMNRRVLQRLSTLSDRELKDIGLTPQDVADARVPGTGDAIHLLVGRRDERREARAATRWW